MDTISILVVDDTPQNLVTLEAILEEPGLKVVGVELGARSAAAPAEGGVRGDSARRPHARHGRLRDREPDPPAPAVQAHADPVPDRLCGRGAADQGLRPGRRRLHADAGPARRPEGQGRRLRRSPSEAPRGAAAGRVAARGRSAVAPAGRARAAESEGRFQVLCTAAPVGIFQLDAGGRCVYASPVWQTTTGGAPEAGHGLALGRRGQRRPRRRDAGVTGRRRSTTGEPWSCESRLRCQGETRWVHVRSSPIVSDDDRDRRPRRHGRGHHARGR